MNSREELLHQATEPINDILGKLDTQINTNKIADYIIYGLILLFLIYYLFFTRDQFDHNSILDFLLASAFLAIFSYFIRDRKKLRKLYATLDNRIVDSKETAIKMYYELRYLAAKVKSNYWMPLINIFIPIVLLFKNENKIFLENVFRLKNPFEGVPSWFPFLFVSFLLLFYFVGVKYSLKRYKEEYLVPLEKLNEVITKM